MRKAILRLAPKDVFTWNAGFRQGRANVIFKTKSPSGMNLALISHLPPNGLKKYKQIKLWRFVR